MGRKALSLIVVVAILASAILYWSLAPGGPGEGPTSPMAAVPSPAGGWSRYHDLAEVEELIIALNSYRPDLVELLPIGRSWMGNTIWVLRITDEFSPGPKLGILIVGYHHARERISLEVPLYIAWSLVREASRGRDEAVALLLDHVVFYVIPVLNPDGVEASEANPWHRKNLRPVDDDGDGLVDEDPPEDLDGDGTIYMWWNATSWGFEGLDNDGDGLLNEDWPGGVDLN
ncbi:hypothetical protein DRO32_03680, partial [Candidatus Bathyarchaeota archaeon]